jgi:hypothetical protein
MGDQVYPRRRDVRERLEELFEVLHRYYDDAYGFDRDFLTDVRDMMRAGCDVETAVLASVPESENEFPYDEELAEYENAYYHWLGSR